MEIFRILVRWNLLFLAEQHTGGDCDDGGDQCDGHDEEQTEANRGHADAVLLVRQDDGSIEILTG